MKTTSRISFLIPGALSILLALLLTISVNAQTTPKQGSPERKAIMDAARIPVEKDLKKKVIFKIGHLKVHKDWAFMYAQPLQANGKPMDYKTTKYAEDTEQGAFEDQVCILLRKNKGKWKVVKWNIGATDVVWLDWDKEFKAPSSIFPKLQE
jgi:hypothetical protein